jgi:RNA polymerase sigma factor (sigma-70 family)
MDEDAPTQSDDELALNIACGDEDAIRAFITLYGPRIQGYLRRNFSTIWEDAWQEFLIHLVDKANMFDSSIGSLNAWSMEVAKKCAFSVIRIELKQRFTSVREDIEIVEGRKIQASPTPKQQKKIDSQHKHIREAVNALPPKELRVILADLNFWRGNNGSDEVAPACELVDTWGDTNENSIYQARNRARKKLREELMRRGIYREENKS